jgi:SNF2 family DNA or RNA helicase
MPKQRYFPDWQIKPGAENEIHSILNRHSMRVLKKDCLDLPPLVRQTIYCELTDGLAGHYRELEEDFITFINGEACVAELAITKLLRLQQVCNGIIPTESGIQRKDCAKLAVLFELLEELTPDHKVIVWSNFIPTYDDITDCFNALGLRYGVIRGGQNSVDRQSAIDAFNQDASVRVILANQQAGGVGIGLQAADYMIYYSKNFSLEQDLQSEARAHRGGSEIHEKITRIDLVTKGTVEEDVTAALASKLSNSELILSLKQKHKRGKAA